MSKLGLVEDRDNAIDNNRYQTNILLLLFLKNAIIIGGIIYLVNYFVDYWVYYLADYQGNNRNNKKEPELERTRLCHVNSCVVSITAPVPLVTEHHPLMCYFINQWDHTTTSTQTIISAHKNKQYFFLMEHHGISCSFGLRWVGAWRERVWGCYGSNLFGPNNFTTINTGQTGQINSSSNNCPFHLCQLV